MPSSTRLRAFLLVFSAFFLLALILSVAAEFSEAKWVKTTLSIGERLGRQTFVAIAATFILVEGVPVLAAWIKREEIKEARAKGRAEERKAWQAWLREMDVWEQDKAEAEKEGRDFTEPRPSPPGDD